MGSLISRLPFFNGAAQPSSDFPDVFPLPMANGTFVDIDVQNIYARILTDVLERTDGIKDEDQPLLWDNCLANESNEGLVTMLAKAMSKRDQLFLVLEDGLKVIRKATPAEQQTIVADYKDRGESDIGIFITFKEYKRSDMVRLYSGIEYCAVGGLWKQSNVSKAIQFKFTELRASVGLSDSSISAAQAKAMAEGLGAGKDLMMDAKDVIELAKVDVTATEATMELVQRKRSEYLNMPASYFNGEQKKGMTDTGKADARAVERGLKGYYFSIIKPVLEALFEGKTTFKSDDFEQLDSSLEALKTFDVTSDDHLSAENKTKLTNKLFGLPVDTKGDPPKKPDPVVPPVVVPPAPGAKPEPPKQPAS